eukprot:7390265-Prymnesium_polylepis.1
MLKPYGCSRRRRRRVCGRWRRERSSGVLPSVESQGDSRAEAASTGRARGGDGGGGDGGDSDGRGATAEAAIVAAL